MTALLEIRHVSLWYHGVHALRDVDLTVEKGRLHGLIGPNGAGKTTLFNVMTGLTPPGSGTLLYEGQSIGSWSTARRARSGIQRVFQITQLFSSLSIQDHFSLLAGKDAADPWIERLNLKPWLSRKPPELPFGVARQVELALVLSIPCRLLLLDEPAAGLTELERTRLGQILKELIAMGYTAMVVEHDLDWTVRLVDTLTVLDRGTVIATGDPKSVAHSRAVRAAYLGEDPTEAEGTP